MKEPRTIDPFRQKRAFAGGGSRRREEHCYLPVDLVKNDLIMEQTMTKRDCKALTLALLALAVTVIQPRAQSVYTPYAFTTLADGTGIPIWFNNPQAVAGDTNGNIYVADTANNTIRKATPTGTDRTLAGLAGSA